MESKKPIHIESAHRIQINTMRDADNLNITTYRFDPRATIQQSSFPAIYPNSLS